MKYLLFLREIKLDLDFHCRSVSILEMESRKGTPEIQRENIDPHQLGYGICSHKSISKEIQLQYLNLQFLENPSFQNQ